MVRVDGWCDGGGTDRVAIKCGVGEVVGVGRESEFVCRSCVGMVAAVSAVEWRMRKKFVGADGNGLVWSGRLSVSQRCRIFCADGLGRLWLLARVCLYLIFG